MIKKYNQYIKENFTYRYPFERIMILINNVDEYYKVYDFVEKEFNIKIRKDRNVDYLEGEVIIHIMLNVRIIYGILYRSVNFVKETDILRFYSTDYDDIDDLINAIKQQCDSNYFNEKDILSIDELSSVISLLRTGKKANFNVLYNKPRKNVYESLLDDISGPSKYDFGNYYNNEYKKGNINEGLKDDKSYRQCGNYVLNVKRYNSEKIKSIYEILFKNGYTIGGNNKVKLLKEYQINAGLIIIYENKEMLYTDKESISDDSFETVADFFNPYSKGEDFYYIKELEDFYDIFNHKTIKNYFSKYNVYESLLDNIEGPSKEEVLNSLNIKGDSIEECFEYIINHKELEIGNYLKDDYETSYYYFFNDDCILILDTDEKMCCVNEKYINLLFDIFNIRLDINYLKNKLLYMGVIPNDYSVIIKKEMYFY